MSFEDKVANTNPSPNPRSPPFPRHLSQPKHLPIRHRPHRRPLRQIQNPHRFRASRRRLGGSRTAPQSAECPAIPRLLDSKERDRESTIAFWLWRESRRPNRRPRRLVFERH
jgi:hypothetical protein